MNHLLLDVLRSPVPRFVMCELATTAAWTSGPLRAPLDLLTLANAAEHWQVEPIVDYSLESWSPPQAETFAAAAPRPRAAGSRH
jgi:hypothetical protein